MPSIRAHLQALAAKQEKAAGLFFTNGFPDPASTLPILQAVDRAGADFIELGMPFSDPLAEGLPIQHASERALRHGVRMKDTFRTAEQFRSQSETPLLLMGYVNPLMRYGLAQFCRDAGSAGVDGLILPDLPPEEAAEISAVAASERLEMVFLVAPNTREERILQVGALATGFVYAVSMTGVTGGTLGEHGTVDQYLERTRALLPDAPLLVGFGIKTHADAVRLSAHTDGFIVGSALINMVESLWDGPLPERERLRAVEAFVRRLKTGSDAESAAA